MWSCPAKSGLCILWTLHHPGPWAGLAEAPLGQDSRAGPPVSRGVPEALGERGSTQRSSREVHPGSGDPLGPSAVPSRSPSQQNVGGRDPTSEQEP